MGRKKQRNSRRRRQPRAAGPNDYLVTIGTGPSEGPCDCPICQIMGIDLSEGNGIDVRPISATQKALLETVYGASGSDSS